MLGPNLLPLPGQYMPWNSLGYWALHSSVLDFGW